MIADVVCYISCDQRSITTVMVGIAASCILDNLVHLLCFQLYRQNMLEWTKV